MSETIEKTNPAAAPAMTPTAQAEAWLDAFAAALAGADAKAAGALFTERCFWRDLLAFTWNIRTAEGRAAVEETLQATLANARPENWRLLGEATIFQDGIEAPLAFETVLARCEGKLRLRDGLCEVLFTAMEELKGFEERQGPTRPLGMRQAADRTRRTWGEEREAQSQALGRTAQPYVVIIGGGQGGMALGARLKQLGVPAVILEKNDRAGDSWRNRYRSLVLHDPVWYDHLPYIPFPAHWPVFTPKDKMGDWLEMYAQVMELDYWTSSTCTHAAFSEDEKVWTVEVDRAGERITLKPTHLVFATGAYGPPRVPVLPGADDFAGELMHSSRYRDGRRFAGKRVAVIGAGSSAHDISLDLWEAGASVTMIQRTPSTVVRSETLMELGFGLYSETALESGISTKHADMILAAMPYALMADYQRELYKVIRERDADFYRQLGEAGFAFDFGEDESGLAMKAWRTGSGFYIDVGASELIINGEIKVESGAEIERLTQTGIALRDGRAVEADAVILSTGFQSMHETVAELVSRAVADKVGPCWGLGSDVRGDPGPWQGEPRNMWKPTAQENLWFHGGNLALSRFYSRFLALQLKARMEKLPTPVFGPPSNSQALR